MTSETIDKLTSSELNSAYSCFICPKCRKGKFSIKKRVNDRREYDLLCDICFMLYPVIDGIPRLVDSENYSESFGYQWNLHRKTQLDSNSGLSISHDRLYEATGWSDKTMEGQQILEAGSGAGRFTEILVKTKANIFSFDFSNAVEANAKNNGLANNLVLFQADIFNIPLPESSFDQVLCLGVIQHTPDPEASFFSLAKMVKPGGKLSVDVYTQSWYHYLHWKYILRPITKKLNPKFLYSLINTIVPPLVPISSTLRKLFGRIGSRLVPIVEFSHLGLSLELNKEWSILDTFDMYSPAHDHPQSLKNVRLWFFKAGFEDIKVWYGANGVVARGRRPS
jgi:SAM-dependent methyltransferase